MFDVAKSSAGACISLATSSDERYPPENMIDGRNESFWMTTGLYPQEFILTFASLMTINAVTLSSYNLRKLVIEKSTQSAPQSFEPLREALLESTDNQLQTQEFKFNGLAAQHLRFQIESGYDHFVSVHEVSVDGSAVRN